MLTTANHTIHDVPNVLGSKRFIKFKNILLKINLTEIIQLIES